MVCAALALGLLSCSVFNSPHDACERGEAYQVSASVERVDGCAGCGGGGMDDIVIV